MSTPKEYLSDFSSEMMTNPVMVIFNNGNTVTVDREETHDLKNVTIKSLDKLKDKIQNYVDDNSICIEQTTKIVQSKEAFFQPEINFYFKIRLLGDAGVGKKHLKERYIDGKYADDYHQSSDSEKRCKEIEIDGYNIKLDLWHAYFGWKFSSGYAGGSHLDVYCYDITDRFSFDSAKTKLFESNRAYSNSNAMKMLVGLKMDYLTKRVVDADEGRELASDNGIGFMECSSKTGENVMELFDSILRSLISRHATQNRQDRMVSIPGSNNVPNQNSNHKDNSNCLIL